MTATTTDSVHHQYSDLPNKMARAANGIDYAYRDTGLSASGGVPLVLFQHFRGNLDSWDPALIDALASARRVITFDNAGVAGSTGTRASNDDLQLGHGLCLLISLPSGLLLVHCELFGRQVANRLARGLWPDPPTASVEPLSPGWPICLRPQLPAGVLEPRGVCVRSHRPPPHRPVGRLRPRLRRQRRPMETRTPHQRHQLRRDGHLRPAPATSRQPLTELPLSAG